MNKTTIVAGGIGTLLAGGIIGIALTVGGGAIAQSDTVVEVLPDGDVKVTQEVSVVSKLADIEAKLEQIQTQKSQWKKVCDSKGDKIDEQIKDLQDIINQAK